MTAFELTPSSTAAGAHADVTIATSFARVRRRRAAAAAAQRRLPPSARPRRRPVRHASGAPRPPTAPTPAPRRRRSATVAAQATAVPIVGLPGLAAAGDRRPLQPRARGRRAGAARRGASARRPPASCSCRRRSGRGRATAGSTRSSPTCRRELGRRSSSDTERMAFTLHGRPAGGTRAVHAQPDVVQAGGHDRRRDAVRRPDRRSRARAGSRRPTCGALRVRAAHRGHGRRRTGMTARQRASRRSATVISQGAGAGRASRRSTVTLPPVVAPDLAQLSARMPGRAGRRARVPGQREGRHASRPARRC